MLIKRIYILKGKGCSGILKVKNLEGAYCEIQLNTYNTVGADLCFILKADEYTFIENLENHSLKRKLHCMNADNIYSAICDRRRGEIVMWAGESLTQPYFLTELALKQKYPMIKREEVKSTEITEPRESIIKEERTLTPTPLLEETKEEPKEKEEIKNDGEAINKEDVSIHPSIEEKFGITSLSNEVEGEKSDSKEDESEIPFKLALAMEILEKYHLVDHNEELELLCNGSKWIIETNKEKDFSLGVLFDSDGTPTHVCYAHKGVKSDPPEFTAEWLSDNDDKGYWVVYEEINC